MSAHQNQNQASGSGNVVVTMAPRISGFGAEVVQDIAARLHTDPRLVMRAMLHVALHHQSELREVIAKMSGLDLSEW